MLIGQPATLWSCICIAWPCCYMALEHMQLRAYNIPLTNKKWTDLSWGRSGQFGGPDQCVYESISKVDDSGKEESMSLGQVKDST